MRFFIKYLRKIEPEDVPRYRQAGVRVFQSRTGNWYAEIIPGTNPLRGQGKSGESSSELNEYEEKFIDSLYNNFDDVYIDSLFHSLMMIDNAIRVQDVEDDIENVFFKLLEILERGGFSEDEIDRILDNFYDYLADKFGEDEASRVIDKIISSVEVSSKLDELDENVDVLESKVVDTREKLYSDKEKLIDMIMKYIDKYEDDIDEFFEDVMNDKFMFYDFVKGLADLFGYNIDLNDNSVENIMENLQYFKDTDVCELFQVVIEALYESILYSGEVDEISLKSEVLNAIESHIPLLDLNTYGNVENASIDLFFALVELLSKIRVKKVELSKDFNVKKYGNPLSFVDYISVAKLNKLLSSGLDAKINVVSRDTEFEFKLSDIVPRFIVDFGDLPDEIEIPEKALDGKMYKNEVIEGLLVRYYLLKSNEDVLRVNGSVIQYLNALKDFDGYIENYNLNDECVKKMCLSRSMDECIEFNKKYGLDGQGTRYYSIEYEYGWVDLRKFDDIDFEDLKDILYMESLANIVNSEVNGELVLGFLQGLDAVDKFVRLFRIGKLEGLSQFQSLSNTYCVTGNHIHIDARDFINELRNKDDFTLYCIFTFAGFLGKELIDIGYLDKSRENYDMCRIPDYRMMLYSISEDMFEEGDEDSIAEYDYFDEWKRGAKYVNLKLDYKKGTIEYRFFENYDNSPVKIKLNVEIALRFTEYIKELMNKSKDELMEEIELIYFDPDKGLRKILGDDLYERVKGYAKERGTRYKLFSQIYQSLQGRKSGEAEGESVPSQKIRFEFDDESYQLLRIVERNGKRYVYDEYGKLVSKE